MNPMAGLAILSPKTTAASAISPEPPAQPFDNPVERLPFLFFAVQHAPEVGGAFGVAVGLADGDRLVVSVDPMLTEAPVLGEQAQKVVGLPPIGHRGRSHGEIGI